MFVVPFAHRAPGPDAQAAAFASHRASPAPALLPHELGLRPTQPLYSDAVSEQSAPQTAPSLGAYTDVAMGGGGTATDERALTATPFTMALAGRPSEPPQTQPQSLGLSDEPELEHPYSRVKRLDGGGEPFDLQLAPASSSASGPPAMFTVRVSRGVTGLGFRVVGGADHGFPVTVASVTNGALLCSRPLDEHSSI